MDRQLSVASILIAVVTAACTTVVSDPAPTPRAIYREAPPAIAEVRPPPQAGYNWVQGHYVWRENEWRWQPGFYAQAAVRPMPPAIVEPVPPASGYQRAFVPGHWQWGGNDWVWVRGHWLEN